MNKENINRVYTQIPVPLDTAASLLVNKLKCKTNCEVEQRHPLKTINSQQLNQTELAGPSRRIKKVSNASKQPIDTRHVTLRRRDEQLDHELKGFKDNSKENTTIIIVSDDEDTQRKDIDESKNSTPVLHLLEPNRVKNVKRSLKRPHSRELQGISSVPQQNIKDDEKSKKLATKYVSRDYADDVISYLLNIENKSTISRLPSITRACVINWLLKVNSADGSSSKVQTACWYLDSILGTENIQLDKLQLIAAACYWISQKWHGPSVLASRLVKCSNKAFSASALMAAEKYVLCKLKFPRQPVVPDDFITYLSWWCDESHPDDVEVPATFICMSGLLVNRKMSDEYPSVLAMAAVWNSLFLLRRKDLMKRLRLCPMVEDIQKKTTNLDAVASMQRKAIRMMATPSYEYKTLLEQYCGQPYCIAERIVKALNMLTS